MEKNNLGIVTPQHYFCEKHTRIRVLDWDSIEDGLEQQIK